MLLIARAIEGVGSSCINVSGMSLIAHVNILSFHFHDFFNECVSLKLYPEDYKRSRIMGIILGSIAMGVLIGYPLG